LFQGLTDTVVEQDRDASEQGKLIATVNGDREEIAALAKAEIKAKYLRGQAEHRTDLPTGGLSWFASAAREESIDQIAYTHHIVAKCAQLRALHGRMCEGLMTLAQAAEEMGAIISCNPPEKHPQS
jgi:PIN domain nuclease of toxin-antitoxin system